MHAFYYFRDDCARHLVAPDLADLGAEQPENTLHEVELVARQRLLTRLCTFPYNY